MIEWQINKELNIEGHSNVYTAVIGKYSFLIYKSGWDNKWHVDAKPTTDEKPLRSWNVFNTLKAAKRCCEGFAL